MLTDIFNIGRLEMSAKPLDRVLSEPSWGDLTVNRILIAAAIILFMVSLPGLIKLLPDLAACCLRQKANTDLEHSINRAKQRNVCLAFLLLPFCLLADRFQLYRADFITENIPEQWGVAAMAGILLTYILLRRICFLLFGPSHRTERVQASHNVLRSTFTVCVVFSLLIVGILSLFGCADSITRTVLLLEMAVFFLITLVRSGQIMAQNCNGFATFLYICALEIVPAAVIACISILF